MNVLLDVLLQQVADKDNCTYGCVWVYGLVRMGVYRCVVVCMGVSADKDNWLCVGWHVCWAVFSYILMCYYVCMYYYLCAISFLKTFTNPPTHKHPHKYY